MKTILIWKCEEPQGSWTTLWEGDLAYTRKFQLVDMT